MNNQRGFSLFELMIAIMVIAVLSVIAVPSYQGYVQKAALTDVLQSVNFFRTATELCYFDQGTLNSCQNGQQGVPVSKSSQYSQSIRVNQGKITLIGRNTLQGLTIVLTPSIEATTGELLWRRHCQSSNGQQSLIDACKSVFRFSDGV